jgi:hypothetical protein
MDFFLNGILFPGNKLLRDKPAISPDLQELNSAFYLFRKDFLSLTVVHKNFHDGKSQAVTGFDPVNFKD